RMTDMDLKVKDPAEMEELLASLATRISISGAGKQNFYAISFQADDPNLAKRVVQAVLNIFVESTLGASRKDTDIAQQFLEQQIREYESRLISAEDKLKEFKRKHVGMMPGQGGGYFSRMERSQQDLQQVRLELREAEMRRDALEDQLDNESPVAPVFQRRYSPGVIERDGPSPTDEVDKRIAALTQNMDELLTVYTDKHPDVVALSSQIKALEKKRLEILGVTPPEEQSAPSGDGVTSERQGMEQNPLYMEMKVALAAAEAEVASLTVRSGEFERRLAALQEMVDTVPQVEAELKRLNRDYDVNRKQYDALLAKLETARISQEAEQSSDNVKFRIVDPPRVPLSPTGPNRPVFFAVVLVLGLGAGFGVAFVMSLIRPTFDNRRIMEDVTELPVLGTVTMIWTPAQQWRKRFSLLAFIISGAALVVVFGGVLFLEVVGLETIKTLPGVSRFL
ncbi:MAG: XrtA system polysaccharide chain length determinant, partial [Gammaproteobacteria bacterium]